MVPMIAVVRHSNEITDDDALRFSAAFQNQVTRDFAATHGPDAVVSFYTNGMRVPSGAWLLALLDDSDQADALGYHEATRHGLPLGKVFVRTTKRDGGIWTVAGSHEGLEMLGDPFVNKVATVDGPHGMRLYAYEVADAPEADELGYEIDGVRVSDFVTPEWFDPRTPSHTITSFARNLRGPLSLAKGGYIGICDVTSPQGWTQLTDDRPGARAQGGRFGFPRHSRRERRACPRNLWRASTSHGHEV